MKNQVLYSVLAIAAAAFVYGCQKPMTESPALELDPAERTVPAEGGEFSVSYKVVNPAEGARPEIDEPDVDWVKDFAVSDSRITFQVAENDSESQRKVTVAVSYSGAAGKDFTIIQEGGVQAPFTIEMKEITTNSYTFDVIPYDKEMYFFYNFCSQNYLDSHNLTTDDALFNDDMLYYGGSMGAFLSQGDQIDVKNDVGISPSTEYVIYAYGMDPVTLERITDIVYKRFTTLEPEKVDVEFNVVPHVDGPSVTLDVAPVYYEGYWTAFAFKTSELDPEESLFSLCTEALREQIGVWSIVYTPEQLLEKFCKTGEQTVMFSNLQAESDYTIAVVAVNENVEVNSEPSRTNVTTGAVSPSDNVLDISVSGITSTSATISISTTNNDPYRFVITSAKELEGMDDRQIIDLCVSLPEGQYNSGSGPVKGLIDNLEPSTEYSVLACGVEAGTATTGLFSKNFTTSEAVDADVKFELLLDGYYDLEQTVGAFRSAGYDDDADYLAGLDGEAIMTFKATTDPEVSTYYYMMMPDVEGNWMSDEEYVSALMANGASAPDGYIALNYDTAYLAVGVAVNDLGNTGPVWKKSFTLTSDGVSDPQGFIDYVYGTAPASARSCSSKAVSVSDVQNSAPAFKLTDVNANSEDFRRSIAVSPDYFKITAE